MRMLALLLAVFLSGCLASAPPPIEEAGKSEAPPLEVDVPIGNCTNYYGLFQVNYELVRHLEHPDYPFFLQGLNDEVTFRIDGYSCLEPGEDWGHDATFLSVLVVPTLLEPVILPKLDFFVLDAIAAAYSMQDYFSCVFGEASHGWPDTLPPDAVNRVLIEADGEIRYAMTSTTEDFVSILLEPITRLHSANGQYLEINGTLQYGFERTGIIEFPEYTLGGLLPSVSGKVGRVHDSGLRIEGDGSDCRYDSTPKMPR